MLLVLFIELSGKSLSLQQQVIETGHKKEVPLLLIDFK